MWEKIFEFQEKSFEMIIKWVKRLFTRETYPVGLICGIMLGTHQVVCSLVFIYPVYWPGMGGISNNVNYFKADIKFGSYAMCPNAVITDHYHWLA